MKQTRRGSTQSDRQLAKAAQADRLCSFSMGAGDSVVGWVAGIDDYHFTVVDHLHQVYLVHKSCSLIQILNSIPPPEGTASKMVDAFVKYLESTNQGEQ